LAETGIVRADVQVLLRAVIIVEFVYAAQQSDAVVIA
jgi:hypothetical protein